MVKDALTCRGCLTQVKGEDFYSFVWKEIRDLFTGCSGIEIGPDENECFPQQLCSVCYNKCEDWRSFRDMCKEGDDRLQRKAQELVSVQVEDEPTIRIKEEEMDVDTPSDLESFLLGEVFKEEDQDEESPEETVEQEDGEQCPVCDLVLPESVPLKKHLKEHYSEKNPKCPICKKLFTRSSKVFSHIMSLHMRDDEEEQQSETPKEISGERPFACGFCDSSFKRDDHRIRHWKTQHRHQESPRKRSTYNQYESECPVCHKWYHGLSQLHRHFVVHTEEWPYTCNYCQKDHRYKYKLNDHIRLYHPKESVEKGVSIKEDSIFKSERPWESMGFFDIKQTNKQRVRVKEIVPKPLTHVCPVCDKGFTSQSQLVRHSVVHTGEKPFQCVYCPQNFSQKAYSLRHARQSHPKEPLADAIVLKKGTQFSREMARIPKRLSFASSK